MIDIDNLGGSSIIWIFLLPPIKEIDWTKLGFHI